MNIKDPISLTARLTAAARARESLRPDRLFDDPLAAALAGSEGVALMARLEMAARPVDSTEPLENPYIAMRTRFFDDFLATAVAESHARQIVLVAAGLDSRAFRLDWPDGTRLFELDRGEVLRAKQEVLDGLAAEARCDRRVVAVDFLADWGGALVAAGFDVATPSVCLIEGLFPYLDEAAAGAVVEQSARLAAPGSRLGADIVGRSMLESPWTRAYLAALARENSPWLFGTDEPEAFFGVHGWVATAFRPGDRQVSYGRWPYPVAPRGLPGIPQSFLITAKRG
jgi:methyltransferase (TIGR00027 family)